MYAQMPENEAKQGKNRVFLYFLLIFVQLNLSSSLRQLELVCTPKLDENKSQAFF